MLQKKLTMRRRGEIRALPLGQILYLEKERKKIRVHTREGDYVYYASFPEAMLDLDCRFSRFHRSFIVNMDMIRCLCENQVELDDGTVLTFGEKPFLRLKRDFAEFIRWKREILESREKNR